MTTLVNTQEKLEKLLDSDGNLIVNGSIEFTIPVVIRGFIEAGESIEAGSYIKAGWSIQAGGYVLALLYDVQCTELITQTLPYWRNYYAAFLNKEDSAIVMNNENCWYSIREKLQPKAEEIAEMTCWPPIIRAQIRMYFKLSESEKL